VSALERVLSGEIVIDVPDAPPRRMPEPSHALRLAAHLTGRERQCLLMLVEGLDTAAMVERLGVSRTTVRTHLQAVLTKLGVHSRLEAASFAVRHRLPDLWSEERPAVARSKVRPIRLVQTPDVAAPVVSPARVAASVPPRLQVAAGQIAGSA
jgi:DNA-binding CsgD family transcriptional regulator